MRRLTTAVALIVALWLVYFLVAPEPPPPVRKSEPVTALSADNAGYARADDIREFTFPADHGAHPGFRHEWWYFTGNLASGGARRFGYELTIFRIALSPARPERASAWATNQVFMAHLALTDDENDSFRFYERFSRGAFGLAGARPAPFKVWLEDWTVSSGNNGFPWRLTAAAGQIALDLELMPTKPLVLQGEQGLDRKSAEGHASYYYSYTRLATTGSLRLDGEVLDVQGLSWLDREWSSGSLAADQQGWDWFALQLDDGSDLMFYRLRQQNGLTDPYSGGVWVAPDGASISLAYDELSIDALDSWQSPRGGTYPSRWQLALPSRGCELTVTPIVADQELDVSVRYWEGAVDVAGACAGRRTSGWGYVELAGYGGIAESQSEPE